ncbi:MAG: phage terminase large subunit [Chloroflexi bacterium]|nr:phage terminase large subunit [Chloroflexota bacterium]
MTLDLASLQPDLQAEIAILPPELQDVTLNPEPWEDHDLAERSLHEFVRQMWRYVDPAPFRDNWHLGVICEHLEAVTRGEIQRLLINIPPRHTKSLIVAVMWPAWTWIQRRSDYGLLAGPEVKFMSASYAQTLSVRDSVKCRRLIDSATYQNRWGHRFHLTSDQNTKIRFENNKGGYRVATSVGGALTGEGGDIIIVDDPINAVDADSEITREATLDWWDESMSTRLNDPDAGAYVIIMQRLHHQDLTGHVLDKDQAADADDWTHLCLPARYEHDHPHHWHGDIRTQDGELLWPDRFSEQAIRRLESNLGSYGAAGQLQQRPSPRSGGMFDRAWWADQFVDAAPSGGQAVRGWDLASTTRKKSPWTVGVLMRRVGGDYFIEDIVRVRGTPRTIERTLRTTAETDGHGITQDLPQDPGQAGKSQVQHLVRMLAPYEARYSPESGDKTERAKGLSAQAEARNVYLVRGAWNRAFIEEAALFPNSDYKDQVDGASRSFHRLTRRRGSRGMTAPVLLNA